MNHPLMLPEQSPLCEDWHYLRAQRKRYDPEHEEDGVPFAGLFALRNPSPLREGDI
jgi:hypothetical protein